MSNILKKTFKCFEIQTKMEYLDKITVETPDGKLQGFDALKYNIEKNENIVSAIGGEHYLDYKKVVGGELVDLHIHIYCKLKDSRTLGTILGYLHGKTVSEKTYIAPDLNNPDSIAIGTSQIETIHSSFSKCYEYLLHKDKKSLANPLKHQYTEEEVRMWTCGTTVDEVQEDTEKANGGGRSIFTSKSEDFIAKYGELLESGTLKRWNYTLDKDIVSDEDFLEYNIQFNKYFDREDEIRMEKIRNEGIQMKVMYLYGDAGSGKTTFAKQFAKDRNLDYFVSGSSNDPFDGYLGQPVVILDDLRGSCFAFADLLKLLDNNTRSKIKSRYYNKVVAAEYIIITSIMPLEDLYKSFQSEEYQEPIKQLKRRCEDVMHFTMEGIEVFHWSKSKEKYDKVCTLPNSVILKMREEEIKNELSTPEAKMDFAMSLLGSYADGIKDMVQYYDDNKEEIIKQSEYGTALKENESYDMKILQAEYAKYRDLEIKAGTKNDCIFSFSQWLKNHNYKCLG